MCCKIAFCDHDLIAVSGDRDMHKKIDPRSRIKKYGDKESRLVDREDSIKPPIHLNRTDTPARLLGAMGDSSQLLHAPHHRLCDRVRALVRELSEDGYVVVASERVVAVAGTW